MASNWIDCNRPVALKSDWKMRKRGVLVRQFQANTMS